MAPSQRVTTANISLVPEPSLDDLLAGELLLHTDADGQPVSWQLGADVLRVLDETVGDTSRTLETGEGLSTILFALRRAHHTCVTPNAAAIARIRSACEHADIALDTVDFIVGNSESVLPGLELPPLDVVLIDGRHGFPAPFIDYYYTADVVKVGGLLIVDDTQLWTGRVLREFLESEPEWRMAWDFAPRSAIFAKTQPGGRDKEWNEQPYVVSHPGVAEPQVEKPPPKGLRRLMHR